jgi:integrative and conjugative element protein (TIGR02256 family)
MSSLRDSVGQCFLPHGLFQQMCAEADARGPNETGGVLLGVAMESAVWIEVVIGPGPTALHGRTHFVPDSDYHQEQIASAYERSGRRLSYLGDWHTHPGGGAYLSSKDSKTLRAIGRQASARQPNPIMAVLAGGEPWTLAIWRLGSRAWFSARRTPEEMTVEIH